MTNRGRQEGYFTLAQLRELLSQADESTVLVGGQALAYWVDYYGIEPPDLLNEGISRDSDFLGRRDDVAQIASAIGGTTTYPEHKTATALVGQVTIPLGEAEYLNVDVIDHVAGMKAEKVRERALNARLDDVTFRVMHPVDVLQSRLENLSLLPEKQTDAGIAQAKLAVLVVREYIQRTSSNQDDGPGQALVAAKQVVKIAKTTAGRKAMNKYDVQVLDAIPVTCIADKAFLSEELPRLMKSFRR